MRKALFLFLLALLGLSSVSCSERVISRPNPMPVEASLPRPTRVMIYPVSVYQAPSSAEKWFWLNLTVFDSLSRQLESRGIQAASFEEVWSKLREKGIISRKLVRYLERGDLSSPRLGKKFLITLQESLNSRPEKVFEAARELGCDYVIRPQVISFDYEEVKPFLPWKAGLLPSSFRIVSHVLYGKPQNDLMALIQEMSIGGAVGAIIGSNAHTPFEPPRKRIVPVGHPLSGQYAVEYHGGEDDWDVLNGLVWGGAGMGVAFLSHQGGRSHKVLFQERLFVHKVEPNLPVWASSAFIETEPPTVFNDRSFTNLARKAINRSAAELVKRMFLDLGWEVLPQAEESLSSECSFVDDPNCSVDFEKISR